MIVAALAAKSVYKPSSRQLEGVMYFCEGQA